MKGFLTSVGLGVFTMCFIGFFGCVAFVWAFENTLVDVDVGCLVDDDVGGCFVDVGCLVDDDCFIDVGCFVDDDVGCGCFVDVDCRSEEHTSELQSRLHLVCRLLLEKKKHYQREWITPKTHISN